MGTTDIRKLLREGLVIPAHPLALTAGRKLDERRQRALTRYYVAAGAGGLAVGVHTTQFAIRDPRSRAASSPCSRWRPRRWTAPARRASRASPGSAARRRRPSPKRSSLASSATTPACSASRR